MADAGTNEKTLIRELNPRSGEPIGLTPITAFVGPNNSGKTEALRDILRLAANFNTSSPDRAANGASETNVLRDLTLQGKLNLDRLLLGLTVIEEQRDGTITVQGLGPDLSSGLRVTVNQDIKSILRRPTITARSVNSTALGELMPLRASYFAASRAELVGSSEVARPDKIPESLLQALHDAPVDIHERLDAAFSAAFPGTHLFLDDTARIELSLRVGTEIPARTGDPLVDFSTNEQIPLLERAGAGCQEFACIVLGVLLSPGRFILIDQPEHSLHPKTAWQLGCWLAEQAATTGCQLFVATNSEPLLQGLFSSDSPVTVIRANSAKQIRAIAPDVARELATEPRLANQRALRAVYSDAIILVPGSCDALVYEAVAGHRLLGQTIRYLHAFGAGNLAPVAKLLRRTGIPLGIVTGLDLFQTEDGFCELVTAVSGEETPRPWLATRERLAQHLEGALNEASLSTSTQEVEEFLDQYRHREVAAESPTAGTRVGQSQAVAWRNLQIDAFVDLPAELRSWVDDLLEDLKQRGIYVAPKPVANWFRNPSDGEQHPWLDNALAAFSQREIPADLQAFMNELTTVVASTLTSQGTANLR